MTKKEYADRNIGVTFDFVRNIIDCPEIIDTVPDKAELDFIDKDIPLTLRETAKGKKIAQYKVHHIFEPISKADN